MSGTFSTERDIAHRSNSNKIRSTVTIIIIFTITETIEHSRLVTTLKSFIS
jgi:hypothetical protein